MRGTAAYQHSFVMELFCLPGTWSSTPGDVPCPEWKLVLPTYLEDRPLADWLAWARDHVAASDPLLMGAKRIFADIGDVNSWSYRD